VVAVSVDAPELVQPDEYVVGEGITEHGHLTAVVGFRFDGHWVGYQLDTFADVDLVRTLSAWLDDHAPNGEDVTDA
jgi:hypothetical protein